jgi:hypothetical protein
MRLLGANDARFQYKEINLAVPEILNTIEQSAMSVWIRDTDSLFGFYFILLFHTIGLALLVGGNTVIDLRILGVAPALPLKTLKRLYGIMWAGFGINALTGALLLIAYPTKALTNPVFYAKLTVIALGLIVMVMIKRRVFDDPNLSEESMMAKGRSLAMWSLGFWISAITAGRLLAYTFTYLLYGHLGVLFFGLRP